MSRTFSDAISRFLVASPRIIAPLGGEDDLPIRPPLRFGFRVISADHRLSHPGQSTPHPCGFQVQKRCRGHLTIAGSITGTPGGLASAGITVTRIVCSPLVGRAVAFRAPYPSLVIALLARASKTSSLPSCKLWRANSALAARARANPPHAFFRWAIVAASR
jgi:hypothetical protein